MTFRIFLFVSIMAGMSCNNTKKHTLFTLLDNGDLGIEFSNQLQDSKGTNVFTFRNYYNGGGVAIGDVNNDGLNDIYLTSNQGDNQLLINKGKWKFEDVAGKAGVKGAKYWSTGVTMADINSDGWLDIYVCNSGNANGSETENELFINQKNGAFKEQAKEYGLADRGLSTHAVFFDYDLDGDLDCYVLNNSFRPIGSFDFTRNLRAVADELGGDRLYRNDKGHYVAVTTEAGIYSSDIGFGLGVSVNDVNQDGYPDIYVSNDFFERDYLYINKHNGTFKEQIQDATGHLSLASMGSDIADINNDGRYDIFTTEMLPEGDRRLKTMTSFESYDVVKAKQKDGYFNQYMQNCLQLNNGDGTFSEIAYYSGVAATDWSWGALFFDMDNDGWKDIFVSNGIFKDLTNQDYIEFLANRENMDKIAQGKKFDFNEFTQKMVSTPVSNYAFVNNRNLTFTNKAAELGLDKLSFSNGSAYGDLDNDGDDDLVVNNVNMPPFLYKNNAEKNGNHYLQLRLHGSDKNRNALGSTVKVFYKNNFSIFYHQPARGFQSSTSPNLITIGVGNARMLDSVQIIWPDGRYQTSKNVITDSLYTYQINDAHLKYNFTHKSVPGILVENTASLFDSIPQHQEDSFIDFDNERLMLQMLSTENPALVKGDVNNDGREDFFMGSSKDSESAIFIQQADGTFKRNVPPDFSKHRYLETAGAVFGDFDKDSDLDLIISFGGNMETVGSKVLYPRYFENDGMGNFKRNAAKNLPVELNASVIISTDFDKDGDADLFVGGRSTPGIYGNFPNSYVLKNDGKGNFTDASAQVFGKNNQLGMVTGAQWADIDGNGYDDLIIAGNWMGIRLYENNKGTFTRNTLLEKYKGWWSSVHVEDINGDGKPDIIGGNLGLNSKFRASEKEPVKIYVKDFDNNGTRESVTSVFREGKPYVFHLKQDIVGQLPMLKKRFLKYADYGGKPFNEVFTEELLQNAEIHEINFLESAIFINQRNNFQVYPFPYQAQLSAVNAILYDDLNSDGTREIILAGNFYGFKPEVGRLDANYGQVFTFQNGHFNYLPPSRSGLMLTGQVRSAITIKAGGRKNYLFGRNDEHVISYRAR